MTSKQYIQSFVTNYLRAVAELSAKIAIAEAERQEANSRYLESLPLGGLVPGVNVPEQQEPLTIFVKSNISEN